MTPDEHFSAPVRSFDTGTATIPVRTFGDGPPLVLIHGWPLSGFTWRKVLPALAARHACHVVDLAGAGESAWKEGNDFSFHGHAEHLRKAVDGLGLTTYDLVAHDTGATVARRLAIVDPRARDLVLFDTEIPHHRPPLVPLMQRVMALPGSNAALRALMSSRRYLRSSAGFGGCFHDLSLIDGDFERYIVRPLVESWRRAEGQMLYARGIDWKQLDALREGHAEIRGRVLMPWGEDDPFFPIGLAREMAAQFKRCEGVVAIPKAKLFPHEEHPEVIAREVLRFLEA
jgi:pimeloyl-ACP methyl ester carboxylesterase